jgi:phage-related protein
MGPFLFDGVYLLWYVLSMIEPPKPLPLGFWNSSLGNQPTRDWFRDLPDGDRTVLGKDLRRVQFGWPIGMPLVKSLGSGLWELRTSLPSKREARVMFCVNEHRIVVLNGFIKKTQKTPTSELNLALKRMKDLLS